MEQVISVSYGKVNFTNSSATIAAFDVKPTFDRTLASKAHNTIGTTTAPVSLSNSVRGAVITTMLQVDDGTVICIQMSQTSNRVGVRDGAVFFMARSTGPLIEVRARLPIAAQGFNVGADPVVFFGRADPLGVDELNEMGIEPSRNFINGFMASEEIEECFDISLVQPEIDTKPVVEMVQSSSGEQVAVHVPAPRRRIRIR